MPDIRICMGDPAGRHTAASLDLPCLSSAASAETEDPTSQSAPAVPSLSGLAWWRFYVPKALGIVWGVQVRE